jgi:hypothetical protein
MPSRVLLLLESGIFPFTFWTAGISDPEESLVILAESEELLQAYMPVMARKNRLLIILFMN